MAVLLDTGIVYAYYDSSDRWHPAARSLLTAEAGGLLLPSAVIPEIDHLLGARLGRSARHSFYAGLTDAGYVVLDLPQDKIPEVRDLDDRFRDLELGFVDCAVAVLARLHSVPRIATSDRRHFEPLARTLGWELLPTSSPP